METALAFAKNGFTAVLLGCLLVACSPSQEEQARDPANCEQMKDMPDAYQRCLEEMRP